MERREGFRTVAYVGFGAALACTLVLCTALGSASVPVGSVLRAIWSALSGAAPVEGPAQSIIVSVRLPRVLCTALVGAALSLCGAAMQGLLKNPLADGSTLGVSAGASLGAVLAIAFSITLPDAPFAGTVVFAVAFAFVSLLIILALAYRLDASLATNTIILIGVIFSMFAGSLTSLVVTFAGERVKSILFWTMGSLAGSTYENALLLACAMLLCGGPLLSTARELNAFAIGEDNARHIGVNVRRVRLIVLVCVAALVGVCVSVSGTIGFVGLVIPHAARICFGPNHQRLLPGSAFGGAIFLPLADLAARTLLAPRELPIGVITSFVGSIGFVWIYFSARRRV